MRKSIQEDPDVPLDKMGLLNSNKLPPGGFRYREPSLNWENPDPLNGEGLHHAVRLLQVVRSQNPAANLDPTYAACRKAITDYTCLRLKYDRRWCGLPPALAMIEESKAIAKTGRRCASCGRR